MANNSKKGSVKQEGGSNRIQQLEDETKKLKDEVKNFLSLVTIQTQQLARQEKMLNEMQVVHTRRANSGITMCFLILLMIVFLLIGAVYMGLPDFLREDQPLYLNVKATPVNLPFITAGMKVRFTMGDLNTCVKRLFSGDTLDLSLS
jgi:TolA-binding protein